MTLEDNFSAFPSQPVKWYLLIRDLVRLHDEANIGGGVIWGMVHRGDYDTARQCVDVWLARFDMHPTHNRNDGRGGMP